MYEGTMMGSPAASDELRPMMGSPAASDELRPLVPNYEHDWEPKKKYINPFWFRLKEDLFDSMLFVKVPCFRTNNNLIQAELNAQKVPISSSLVKNLVYRILTTSVSKFRLTSLEQIKGCGSFYEFPTLEGVSDCDYNIDLNIPADFIEITHVCDISVDVPRKARRKRYFKANFTENTKSNAEFVSLWECKGSECHRGKAGIDCVEALNPFKLQEEFKEVIESGMRQVFDTSHWNYLIDIGPDIPKKRCVNLNGPAVSISFCVPDHTLYKFAKSITLDLVISFKPYASWTNCQRRCLVSIDRSLDPRMVPAVDYWRLSFSEDERDMILKCPSWKKCIYLEAKTFRDRVESDFPSYPLKQSFLQILNDLEQGRDNGAVTSRGVQQIYKYMVDKSLDGAFNNYFLPCDPVMEPCDKFFRSGFNLVEKLDSMNIGRMRRYLYHFLFCLIFNIIMGIQLATQPECNTPSKTQPNITHNGSLMYIDDVPWTTTTPPEIIIKNDCNMTSSLIVTSQSSITNDWYFWFTVLELITSTINVFCTVIIFMIYTHGLDLRALYNCLCLCVVSAFLVLSNFHCRYYYYLVWFCLSILAPVVNIIILGKRAKSRVETFASYRALCLLNLLSISVIAANSSRLQRT